MSSKRLIFFFILLISVNFIVAQQTNTAYGFNSLSLPGFNNNTAFVNASAFWNTISLGPLGDVNTTQFFSNAGTLNINETYLASFNTGVFLNLSGGNANQNIDIGVFGFTAGDLVIDNIHIGANTIESTTGGLTFIAAGDEIVFEGNMEMDGNSIGDVSLLTVIDIIATDVFISNNLTVIKNLTVGNINVNTNTMTTTFGNLILSSFEEIIMTKAVTMNNDLDVLGNIDVGVELSVGDLLLEGTEISTDDGDLELSASSGIIVISGSLFIEDNDEIQLGSASGGNSLIFYNSTDMIINPKNVGSGSLFILGNLFANNNCYSDGVNCTTLDNVTNLSLTFLNLSGGNANQNIDIGAFNFTSTELGTFGNLQVDTININANTITSSGSWFLTSPSGGITISPSGDLLLGNAKLTSDLETDGFIIKSSEGDLLLESDGSTIVLTGASKIEGALDMDGQAIFNILALRLIDNRNIELGTASGGDAHMFYDPLVGLVLDPNVVGSLPVFIGGNLIVDGNINITNNTLTEILCLNFSNGDTICGNNSIDLTINDTFLVRFAVNNTQFVGDIENIHNINNFSRFFEKNTNGGNFATSVFSAENDLDFNVHFGITSSGFNNSNPNILANQGFLFFQTPNITLFANGFNTGFRWVNNPSGSRIFNDTNDSLMVLSKEGNLNVTGTINASLINITSTEVNWMEGNLSVNQLVIRSPDSMILGGFSNVTGEAFSVLTADGFNLNLSDQEFGRRVVRLNKDFLMTVNRTNGTIYLASSQLDDDEFAIAVTDAVNSVGWGFQLIKMSVNWSQPHLNRLLGHNGAMDIRTTNTNLIAGAEGITIGFMGIESFDADFDITGFNDETDVIFIENSFGVNPFLTTFFYDVNFTNQTTFENITVLDTVFAGDVISQGLFDKIDNATEINSDIIHNTSLQVLYSADTTNNEITINITFGTISSFQVWDAEKKFNVNSVFVNILNPDGVTIDHSAQLNTRNKAFQFFFNGTVWNYGQIGNGQFVAISSGHDSVSDFGNLIQENDNNTDLTIIGSINFPGDGIGSETIISLVPTSQLDSDANWKGVFIDGDLLDPVGEGANIAGFEVDFSGVNITNNPVLHGIEITVPPRFDAMHIHEGQLVINNQPTNAETTEFSAMDIRVDTVNLDPTSVWSAMGVTAVGDSTGTIAAVLARNQVQPIRQEVGTFTTPSQTGFAGRKTGGSTWVDGVDGFEIFVINGDEVYLGSSSQFSQIEVIMGTVAIRDVQPTFWYNTAADTWTEFFPDDETSGFQSSSLVSWEPDSISASWTNNGDPGAGDSTAGYWIKIIRVRVEDVGTPTPTTMKTGTVEAFGWDQYGVLSIRNLTVAESFTTTGNLTIGNINVSGFYYGNGSQLTGIPGGSTNHVQYNNGGVLDGITGVTVDSGNELVIEDSFALNFGNDLDAFINHDGATTFKLSNSLGEIFISNSDATSPIRFQIGTSTDATSFDFRDSSANMLMTILGDGNVGIGIDTPTTTLDVLGSVRLLGKAATGSVGDAISIKSGSGGTSGVGGEIEILAGDGGSTQGSGGDILMAAGDSDTIGAGGALTLQSGSGSLFGPGGLISINAGTGGPTLAGGAIVLNGGTGGSTSGDGGDVLITGGNPGGSGSRGDVILQSSGGDVGIGTASPTEKLDVNGNVNVNGNLTIGDKIIFDLGAIIDNLVSGWTRITGSLNVTENINVANNITLDSGAKFWSNATCTFLSSPNGGAVLEVCDP